MRFVIEPFQQQKGEKEHVQFYVDIYDWFNMWWWSEIHHETVYSPWWVLFLEWAQYS